MQSIYLYQKGRKYAWWYKYISEITFSIQQFNTETFENVLAVSKLSIDSKTDDYLFISIQRLSNKFHLNYTGIRVNYFENLITTFN